MRHLSGVPNKIYGIGRLPVVKGEVARYWLYPRVENKNTYLNYSWSVINKTVETPSNIFLYPGEKFVDFDIRVSSDKCYQRIVRFLDGVTGEQVVEAESGVVPRPPVNLIGEVLIVDPAMQRRSILDLLVVSSLLGRFGFHFWVRKKLQFLCFFY